MMEICQKSCAVRLMVVVFILVCLTNIVSAVSLTMDSSAGADTSFNKGDSGSSGKSVMPYWGAGIILGILAMVYIFRPLKPETLAPKK